MSLLLNPACSLLLWRLNEWSNAVSLKVTKFIRSELQSLLRSGEAETCKAIILKRRRIRVVDCFAPFSTRENYSYGKGNFASLAPIGQTGSNAAQEAAIIDDAGRMPLGSNGKDLVTEMA
jgi:hypothetical protein